MKEWLGDWGLARGIERHNFLIRRIARKHAEGLVYRGRVLDLGCGKAPYKDIIMEMADEYIGVDWENVRDRSRVDVFSDLSKPLPFDNDFADTIVSFEVLEHLPEPDNFLSECHRVLRPGGYLLMTAPFIWHVHEEPYDYYRFTKYGLEYLLRKNRFSEVSIEEKTGAWLMLALMFNYHTTSLARGPIKYILYLIWWCTQVFGFLMDKVNPGYGRTVLYTIQARKDQIA